MPSITKSGVYFRLTNQTLIVICLLRCHLVTTIRNTFSASCQGDMAAHFKVKLEIGVRCATAWT